MSILNKPYYDFGTESNFKELIKYLNKLGDKLVNVELRGITEIILEEFQWNIHRRFRNYKEDKDNRNQVLELCDLSERTCSITMRMGDIRKIVKGGIFHWNEYLIVMKNGLEYHIYTDDCEGLCNE